MTKPDPANGLGNSLKRIPHNVNSIHRSSPAATSRITDDKAPIRLVNLQRVVLNQLPHLETKPQPPARQRPSTHTPSEHSARGGKKQEGTPPARVDQQRVCGRSKVSIRVRRQDHHALRLGSPRSVAQQQRPPQLHKRTEDTGIQLRSKNKI